MKILRIIFKIFIALTAVFFLVLCLAYFGLKQVFKEPVYTNEIIALSDSSGASIKIVEVVTEEPWPVGTPYAKIELWYRDKRKWRLVDDSRKTTPVYTKFYEHKNRFIQLADPLIYYRYPHEMGNYDRSALNRETTLKFSTGARYKDRYVWDIFINPKDFSPREYELISSIIVDNVSIINDAVGEPREPLEYKTAIGRAPLLTSIVYRQFDKYGWYATENLIPRFKCNNSDLFIGLSSQNYIMLILPVKQTGSEGDSIEYTVSHLGTVTDDQRFVLIKEIFDPKITAAFSGDPMEFYQTCVTEENKNIFDYFEAISIDRGEELKD